MTTEKLAKLREVSAEILAAGDGINTMPIETARNQVSTMDAEEMLSYLGDMPNLADRLGFDPYED